MRRYTKLLSALGVAAVLLVAAPQAMGWWWGPGYGHGYGSWRHAYVYDPAYRWGDPVTRQYIRNLHLYGRAYADWRLARTWWW